MSTIDQLFNVLLNVWCKETAYPSCQKDYDYDNDPTYGPVSYTHLIFTVHFSVASS